MNVSYYQKAKSWKILSTKIYGVTEAHLSSSIPSSLIEIRGYNCRRKDRTKDQGGGNN